MKTVDATRAKRRSIGVGFVRLEELVRVISGAFAACCDGGRVGVGVGVRLGAGVGSDRGRGGGVASVSVGVSGA